MFLHLSVIHSVHRGVCLSACWDTTPPLEADPPDQTPPYLLGAESPWEQTLQTRHTPSPGSRPPWEECMLGDTVNERAVRILLECILVRFKHLLISIHTLFFPSLCAIIIHLSSPEGTFTTGFGPEFCSYFPGDTCSLAHRVEEGSTRCHQCHTNSQQQHEKHFICCFLFFLFFFLNINF